mgnify:CR=1 FL=1
MLRSPFLLFCSIVLAGCVSQPELYAPPAQRKPLDRDMLLRSNPLLEIGNNDAERYFVSDIIKGPTMAGWRWSRKRPTISLPLKSASNLRYRLDFSLPEVTFKETGPVTITFFVNDRELDKVLYDSPGQKTFEKPVPPGFLKEMSDNRLAAEVDKTYLPKDDKQPLGFIITRFGLVQ